MKTIAIIALIGAALYTGGAEAGPANDMARARIDAIAAGNVKALTAAYATDAALHWVGGPLDGTYGNDKLQEVWAKFSKANGPLQVTVSNMIESANPKGATVAANLVFTGKNTIKVRYVLLYREGMLVSEIWQIDPNLTTQPAT